MLLVDRWKSVGLVLFATCSFRVLPTATPRYVARASVYRRFRKTDDMGREIRMELRFYIANVLEKFRIL
ncbi:MAG: hypothetical protein P8J33_04045 [Pirellulaceae bacterium]|nr:hypothetical protein [Pirellulaceae bacterium]